MVGKTIQFNPIHSALVAALVKEKHKLKTIIRAKID
jgi:hypothetical protein